MEQSEKLGHLLFAGSLLSFKMSKKDSANQLFFCRSIMWCFLNHKTAEQLKELYFAHFLSKVNFLISFH